MSHLYNLIHFEVAEDNKHKYVAVLQNHKTLSVRRIPFGDIRYQQYFDQLGYYSHLNHLDPQRRRLYKIRHNGEQRVPYTAGWFSWTYLW